MKGDRPRHDLAEVARLAAQRRIVATKRVVTWLVNCEDWHVKFYVDGDQVVVNVWSCCWDGTVH